MRAIALLPFLFLILSLAPVRAEGDANAAKGLIAEHCIECHRDPAYNPSGGAIAVDAPDFQVIADAPGAYTPERLADFLRRPHFPMKQFTMSERNIQNIIAYLQSLRKE